MSKFSHIPLAPPDPILSLTQAFLQDKRPDKVNLGVGLFKNEKLQTPILKAVKKAEERILAKEVTKEYLPISGDPVYLDEVGKFVFGKERWEKEAGRIAAFQTPGGAGALKVGATFLKEEIKSKVFLSDPSWPNHLGIFSHAGLAVERYPYYDVKVHQVLFDKMEKKLREVPELSTVMLHASCHNPTGMDLQAHEWKQVLEIVHKRGLLPFFDLAYQGLGKGVDEDAASVRAYLDSGEEMLVAVSYSKNLALYAERVGALFIVCKNPKEKESVTSRVKQMIRTNYSNPPMHGEKIAALVLGDPELFSLFIEELQGMKKRIETMRDELAEALNFSSSFSHLKHCLGMFAFLGLKEDQVSRLIKEHGIYMPSDGRINVCGLTRDNMSKVVNAIRMVIA